MVSFDYRLNPLYPIKECSSCGALYTTDYCCSEGSLMDRIICDLNKTPGLSQRPPQNFPKCRNPLCGRGAHYGYNFLPKVLVVSNPKPCHNPNVDELPQTVPSFDPTCYSEDGNSFTYDSTSNLIHDSPNDFDPPLQPPTYSNEFCGNDAYYGQDCSLQFLVIHQPIREKTCAELLEEEQEANINTQPFQYSVIPQPPQEEMNVEFFQEKRNQMNYEFNRISFYEMQKVLSPAWETILEIKLAFKDKHCQPEDILNDDDDEDYTIAVTPSLSTEEPDNSLSMGDEHLDTVSAMESDKFIKYSIESLVPIPSESEDIPNNMCDVPFHDNSPPLEVSKDQFEDFSDSSDDSTSIDEDSFSIDNIEYVEASPPNSELVSSEVMEIVIPEVGGIDDDLLTIKDDILREKLLNSSSTSLNSLLEETNTFDNSLPEFETFCFDLEEISSGSTTTHSDCSLYDSFMFDLLINPFPHADRSDFYEFPDELTHIISPPDESLFAYVVWMFLPFLSYSVAPQYLLSFGNEDTIFDPGIYSYHISSFMPDVSHRSGTFIKFNVLNGSPMEISFSTCSSMDQ
uniref:Uncharacterized protein n=1 Tax=Tanacetum cinerariifolium TaxID=118510 RepID=A0A699HA79_TANCI|nr:hypothetical protein [Tanacetum cinerariifolium]